MDVVKRTDFIVTAEQLVSRRMILGSIQGQKLSVKYHWVLWGCSGMEGVEMWEDCVVSLENDNLLLYDGQGDLRFCRSLDNFMFKPQEDMLTIAWFDDEVDNIYYTLEIRVHLDFEKLTDL